MAATAHCPICHTGISLEGDLPGFFPFCSDRCKSVDLGRWFDEQYSVPVESPRVIDEALKEIDDNAFDGEEADADLF